MGIKDFVTQERFANGRVCPVCGATHVVRNGRRADGTQKYITDKMNFYVRFSNTNGIELVQLKTGKSKKGIYNIQHINSYHSQLKRFMKGFNGVSTKYLNNYLVWHNFVNYAKETKAEKRDILLAYVLST